MSIELICGPMFSGKTSELLRRVRIYKAADKEVILIKWENDLRYSNDSLATHDNIDENKAYCTSSLINLPDGYDVYAIDEGQFFSDLAKRCEELAESGKIVIVAALDGTYKREEWPQISKLYPLCEKIRKLRAICTICKKKAAFTKRTIIDPRLEVIGGKDKYEARCRKCF